MNTDNTVVDLKPSSIVQAAEADFKRREHNKITEVCDMKEYAFEARHVRKSNGSVFALIELALKQPNVGLSSNKRNTRVIYGRPDTLSAALEMVRMCPKEKAAPGFPEAASRGL